MKDKAEILEGSTQPAELGNVLSVGVDDGEEREMDCGRVAENSMRVEPQELVFFGSLHFDV